MSTTAKPAKRRQWPWALFVTGVLLGFAVTWLSTADLDYRPDNAVFPFETTACFTMMLPFLLGFWLAYAAVFCVVARWLGRKVGWTAMLGVSVALLVLTLFSVSPAAHTRAVLRPLDADLAERATPVILSVHDSLIDPRFYKGKITAPGEAIRKAAKRPALAGRIVADCPALRHEFPDERFPESGTFYELDDAYFFLSPESGVIYFERFGYLPE
jgi:hypothetical protein